MGYATDTLGHILTTACVLSAEAAGGCWNTHAEISFRLQLVDYFCKRELCSKLWCWCEVS